MLKDFAIRSATSADLESWAELRGQLWPQCPPATQRAEILQWLSHPHRTAAFVAETDAGELIGFIEVALREYVNGCETSPVAFVEGVYITPPFRRRSIARKLFAAAEDWARALGGTELGSDALLDNVVSHRVHHRLGFAETERVVCFRKKL
jgi:aminoglycoside 6'-N-acetyltransferase I